MSDTPEKLENMTLGKGGVSPCPPPAGMRPKPHQVLLGEIDMRIDHDGVWYYMGTPIARKSLVKLFATVLRRDADGAYWLITPAEMARIKVDDAPFLAVEATETNQNGLITIRFRTNTDREIDADADHPIRVEIDPDTQEPRPYLQIADDGSEARIVRSVFYDLVERAQETDIEGKAMLVLESAGTRFVLGPAAEET